MNTSWIKRLHNDQHGVISVLTVFAVLVLTILLGMVMNMGRHVDSKIRMQNAADAIAFSGGVVIARGLNSLAFTNHLMFDVFALTAFMREAEARNSERYVPQILAAWERVGHMLTGAPLPKFSELGHAIIQKVPLEQDLVTAYSDWAAAAAEPILPVLEEILAQEMIPQYQRAVLEVYPQIAQRAAMEIARLHSSRARGEGPMVGALWRTDVTLVGSEIEAFDRTLPVIDPIGDPLPEQSRFIGTARQQRARLARRYLAHWNADAMWFFDREAKMCQFAALWRSFTCGYLNRLLNQEYPYANLPMLIQPPEETGLITGGCECTEDPELSVEGTELLERDYTFVGVAYRRALPEMAPSVFANPLDSDDVTYAEVRVFVPKRRLVWRYHHPTQSEMPIGGVPGDMPTLPPEEPTEPSPDEEGYWYVGRQCCTAQVWSLLNPRWKAQLVPATCRTLPQILQTPPPSPEFAAEDIQLPNLGDLTSPEINLLSPH